MALNLVTKSSINNPTGGDFMALTFTDATVILDKFTKKKPAWPTRDSEVASNFTM